ncbi:hypothetical protein [Streptomyces longispororuber]|uniref:hypothetical protein n=1 Tax=Streptomyces longispororuber TaxID=68230 RepID=UPI00210EA31E|nr:hypothetical protein [Streptomyces longispororuber]MCQ4208223.1 hypothetical protein [Streptomyces longispororuber]
MWPGEQGPGDGTHHPRTTQPNPYPQPDPYGGQPTPPPLPPRRAGNRTAVLAVVAAAVVVAACVTGVVVVRGGDDGPAPGPTGTAAPATSAAPTGDPRRDGGVAATVEGWRAVVNPKAKVAFDVPPEWAPQSEDWVTSVGDPAHPDAELLIAMRAPAFLQEKWCSVDTDQDGTKEDSPLGFAGTRGGQGARTPAAAARRDAADWVFGGYAQRRDQVTTGTAESFTTASGLSGTLVSAESHGVARKNRCATEGRATTFSFKSPDGDILSWSFVGAADVRDEVPDGTIRRIAATVRMVDDEAS